MESLLIYLDRGENINIIDPDSIPHFEDTPPLLEIMVAIIAAGYEGVAVDEQKLSSGKYFYGLNCNLDSPEGEYFYELLRRDELGEQLPSCCQALDDIKGKYVAQGGDK